MECLKACNKWHTNDNKQYISSIIDNPKLNYNLTKLFSLNKVKANILHFYQNLNIFYNKPRVRGLNDLLILQKKGLRL